MSQFITVTTGYRDNPIKSIIAITLIHGIDPIVNPSFDEWLIHKKLKLKSGEQNFVFDGWHYMQHINGYRSVIRRTLANKAITEWHNVIDDDFQSIINCFIETTLSEQHAIYDNTVVNHSNIIAEKQTIAVHESIAEFELLLDSRRI